MGYLLHFTTFNLIQFEMSLPYFIEAYIFFVKSFLETILQAWPCLG